MSKSSTPINPVAGSAGPCLLAGAAILSVNAWFYPQLGGGGFVLALGVSAAAIGLVCQAGFRTQRALKRELNHVADGLNALLPDTPPGADDASSRPPALNIRQTLQRLHDHLQQLKGQASAADEQLRYAQQASDLAAAKVDRQQADDHDIADQLETLRASFASLQESAGETFAISRKSETEGESGKLAMTEAMSGVMALGESVHRGGALVEALGSDSEAIGGIVNVIKSVAEQTNLLALNAAIEAARAGEQGRGFAVVADEVRSLANKTQDSAQEIENLIQALLRNVQTAGAAHRDSMKLAEKSDELIEGMVMSYSELVGNMVEIETLAQGMIDAATHGQQAATDTADRLRHY